MKLANTKRINEKIREIAQTRQLRIMLSELSAI